MAQGHNYDILEINLEADYEVLAKRFDDRVAGALMNPEKKISNISKETIDYYKRKFTEGEKPVLFLFIPHILYRGSIDVSGLTTKKT